MRIKCCCRGRWSSEDDGAIIEWCPPPNSQRRLFLGFAVDAGSRYITRSYFKMRPVINDPLFESKREWTGAMERSGEVGEMVLERMVLKEPVDGTPAS
ncbi:hypothetical protein NDU88_006498 [Pleurodeles waltl]|uniref:Uncharacterized protein n=1 Tax=Pleurodeles waltl TaxID=8319 RepID=A0AAV7TYJ7_PLEWA|nr:hypothetical protein NDU88_006498 [Pleurodeles waltl]